VRTPVTAEVRGVVADEAANERQLGQQIKLKR
jgi:hypothetical protein